MGMPMVHGKDSARWARSAALAAALLAFGCYDFHLTGPAEPGAVPQPRLVSVTIEYRQPPGCLGGGHCDDRVVFIGSWMRPGTEFALTQDAGNWVWRGVASGVPTNYPPHENPSPYEVRIYDPHLLASPTQGFTAERLRVGGEQLTEIQQPGRPEVHSLVYVDENGQGHNPY